jgi:integrase/recombinase XerD
MGQTSPTPQPTTVAEVIARFLSSHPSTLSRGQYERNLIIRRFANAHGSRTAGDLVPDDLVSWLNSNEGWKSAWTKKGHLGTIKRVFAWAVKQRMLPSNPFAGETWQDGDPGLPMSQADYLTILKNSKPRFARLVRFCRFTGCRPGEACKLEWTHIDWQRCCAVLWQHKTRKTSKKPRIIVLSPEIVRALKWLQIRRPEKTTHIFLNRDRVPWKASAISARLRHIREKYGIDPKATLHKLRHTHATNAILNDVNPALESELLGHSSPRSLDYYVHLAGQLDHLHEANQRALSAWKFRSK